jgi:eukaryotic-like serine/threonine-protein kinase
MDGSLSEHWSRIDRLVEQADGLPPQQRDAFLRGACGADSALCAELRAQLADEYSSPGLLDHPATEVAGPLIGASVLPLPDPGGSLGGYTLVREAGHGGAAAVYLAEDPRHGRSVAVKVLYPEVARSLGRQRFLREIRLAARLQHPHLLPVFDSGETDGWLWFAMPWVSGESLARRLERESPLPVGDALRIAREVAQALDYAHRQGVIHRDVKPGNILLADGQALVADFGIARALGSAVEDAVTESGLVMGTPAYMSPEQAAGQVEVDGRSDIYSLGCVLFEMLAGEPPFPGSTAAAILARRLNETAPPIGRLRPDLPEAIEHALARALARDPANRFDSAGELAQALDLLLAGHPVPPDQKQVPKSPRRRVRVIALLLLAALSATAAFFLRRGPTSPPLDPTVVAVLPFRVTAVDSGIRRLEGGMVDLLYARLTGEAGFRAADPRAVLSAWRQAGGRGASEPDPGVALEVARRLGAGHLVLGQIVQLRDRLSIGATMVDARSGDPTVRTSVDGPLDSVGVLVDRLSAELLALRAGDAEERLGALRGYSWPALRAYIAGRTAARDGRYLEARQDFARALQFDSSFALAAAAQIDVIGMVDEFDLSGERDVPDLTRARALAFALRDRLSPRDRTLLEAQLGRDLRRYTTLTEDIAAWEAATRVAPDRADIWANLADRLYHGGPLLGLADRRRAVAGFERALALDSSFALPHEHLIDLAAEAGDTARVRALTTAYLERHPSSELADYVRWRAGVALEDDSILQRVRTRLPEASRASLQRIAGWSQLLGVRLGDGGRATEVMLARAGNQAEYAYAVSARAQFLANRGRLGEAMSLIRASAGAPPALLDLYLIVGALYYHMDSAGASAAARRLERYASAGRPVNSPPDRAAALCGASRWRVSTGDTAAVHARIARLRVLARAADANAGPVGLSGAPVLCAELLAAMVAPRAHGGAVGPVARLDSIMRTGPTYVSEGDIANLVLARLLEQQGDLVGALAAIRRRWYNYVVGSLWYLPAYLLDEGRLAAAAGDRADAIRAYQHYLALVAEPDSALQPVVRQARTELTRLLSERSN